MKREIYRRINHVLRVLGGKKKVIIDARDESENAISAFFDENEAPPIIEASDEVQQRFNQYMSLEIEIDAWVERRHGEMVQQGADLNMLLDRVHQDMLAFISRIEAI